MQLKIIAHIIVLSSCLTSIIGMAICPSGCYECEEEVWEEVPCDEIPFNGTTISPLLPTKPIHTTAPRLENTTTILITTTTPKTITPIPTTIKASPATTPLTTLTNTTTTTTTPNPVQTPKPKHDTFKKCYCECKVGCKEFCRKVVINPDPKNQIVQFSKIAEPTAQGQIELTHYLQRELKANTVYDKSNQTSSNDSVSQPPITDIKNSKVNTSYKNEYGTISSDYVSQPPITDNNNYSKTESYKYQVTTPTSPLKNAEEKRIIVNNENSGISITYSDQSNLNPVQLIPYAHVELKASNANNKNYGILSSDAVAEPPIINNDYSNTESNKYQSSLPTPLLNNYEEKHSIPYNKNSILAVAHIDKTKLQPVQRIPYAHAEAGFKNINSYSSSQIPQNQPLIKPLIEPIIDYTAPNSATYDFPIPFGNIYSKVSKNLLGPKDSAQISIAPPITNSNPSYFNPLCNGNLQTTLVSPTPAKSSQLETPVSLSSTLNYDDSFDAIIQEFIRHNSAKDVSYETHSSPFYSLSYGS